MKEEDIIIWGIDPAPVKKSTVFDGEKYEDYLPNDLNDELNKIRDSTSKKILICWDAPLIKINESNNGNLYTRRIEKYLQQTIPKGNENKGASVLGYAGCSHWTISKLCLGLPIIGDLDKSDTPFELLTQDEDRSNFQTGVVEVHPAVALFFWCKELPKYKKNSSAVEFIWTKLNEEHSHIFNKYKKPKNDDELDALVAYVLGYEWMKNSNVRLLGDAESGAMLMPDNVYSRKKFKDFKSFEF